MLKLLICRPGRRASKDVLIEGLWPGEKSETINVEHAPALGSLGTSSNGTHIGGKQSAGNDQGE